MTSIRLAGHSCVRFEKDGRVLVVDPGGFSDPQALDGAAAVLVTHEHADHVEPARLTAALAQAPDLQVWAPAPVLAQLTDADPDRLHAVAEGDSLDVAGFAVQVLGHDHAVVHPDLPVAVNVAYLIDESALHPGDSLTPPPAGTAVELLFLPVSAPWLKLSESVDYLRRVAPARAVPIHDAILSDSGRALADRIVGGLAGPGTHYRRPEPGESLSL